MKKLKFFSLLIVALFLLAPAPAQAGGPRISFSLNIFEAFFPRIVAPVAPPPAVLVPCAPPPPVCVEREMIVREYHYPSYYVEELRPYSPYYGYGY